MRTVRVPNARFWVWHNSGWVKLTLAPDQTLRTSYGGRTEEGWSRGQDSWSHDGYRIVATHASESCDCDGRLDYYAEVETTIVDLRARDMGAEFPEYPENRGIFAPEWTKRLACQRDHEAEKAGY